MIRKVIVFVAWIHYYCERLFNTVADACCEHVTANMYLYVAVYIAVWTALLSTGILGLLVYATYNCSLNNFKILLLLLLLLLYCDRL